MRCLCRSKSFFFCRPVHPSQTARWRTIKIPDLTINLLNPGQLRIPWIHFERLPRIIFTSPLFSRQLKMPWLRFRQPSTDNSVVKPTHFFLYFTNLSLWSPIFSLQSILRKAILFHLGYFPRTAFPSYLPFYPHSCYDSQAWHFAAISVFFPKHILSGIRKGW